ncbi:hypothetical protein B0H14DRAFT_1551329 [Mycena olivaceomarginata]|nr:hypothetical protein B0H14DRAFT_1551329 [Mycena olivaceomarginata]
MTADGSFWGRNDGRRVSSPPVLKAPASGSKRTSRSFFSLFSSSKPQPSPKSQPMQSSFPSPIQALPQRFDAISLTSPLQREDPAFSRDPNAHPFMVPRPRDAIRTSRSAPEPAPRLVEPMDANFEPVLSQQQRFAELQDKSRDNSPSRSRYASYSSSSKASESSLTLPSTDSSASVSAHSLKSSSSSSFLSRDVPTIGPSPSEPRESPAIVASGYDGLDAKHRPLSPPPEYELMASPQEMLAFELPTPSRPAPLGRNDSAPELHQVKPPVLPHRSATAPIPGSAPSASGSKRANNDRKPQAYDLDRIDELDESNPLGVALHHEGPFQVIASVLKGPQSQPPPQMRIPKAPKPNGGSLGISPGQVLPRNFSYLYHQPPVRPQPPLGRDYPGSPQASTSYIPPQSQFGQLPPAQFGQPQQSQFDQRPPAQFGQPQQSQFDQRPPTQFGQSQQSQFGQPQHAQSNMRTPPVPQERPNQDPRWSQAAPHQLSPSVQPVHPSPPAQSGHSHSPPHSLYEPRMPYVPETQFDPVDAAPQQSPVHTGNSYYPGSHPPPLSRGHHAAGSSEDNSDAYGGIEVDSGPKRERHSAPPTPTAPQMEPYYAPQNGGPNNDNDDFASRRHIVQAGYAPAPDPSAFRGAPRFNAGQNLSAIRHSPNPNGQPVAGVLNPRTFENSGQLNAEQHSSGIRHSPNLNGQPIQQQGYPQPHAGGYTPPPPQVHHSRNEQDRRRPTSHQPQPTAYANHGQQSSMAEHDPRRRASYQPVQGPPPGAAPPDPGRHEFERGQYQQRQLAALAQDRPQSVTVAPSIASTTNPLRRLPQHTPKHLVMPTPLQQSSPLPSNPSSHAYPNGHYESPNSSQTRLPLQAQPTRAQTIQMDGNRHLLKKRMSAVQATGPLAPVMPPKAPPAMRQQRSYMEPPPTVPGPPMTRPMVQQKEKRPKRLLSKRRSDL